MCVCVCVCVWYFISKIYTIVDFLSIKISFFDIVLLESMFSFLLSLVDVYIHKYKGNLL